VVGPVWSKSQFVLHYTSTGSNWNRKPFDIMVEHGGGALSRQTFRCSLWCIPKFFADGRNFSKTVAVGKSVSEKSRATCTFRNPFEKSKVSRKDFSSIK